MINYNAGTTPGRPMDDDTRQHVDGFLIRPVSDTDAVPLAELLREVMEEFGAARAGSSLHDRAPEMCELRKMSLRPEARGRGLGRAMLQSCLAVARPIGHTGHFGCDAWYVCGL